MAARRLAIERYRDGPPNLRSRVCGGEARILHFPGQCQRLQVLGDPPGDAAIEGHALAKDVVALGAADGRNVELAAIARRQHDGHLVCLALLHRGVRDFVEDRVQVERHGDGLAELVNGEGFAELDVFEAKPTHVHASAEQRKE